MLYMTTCHSMLVAGMLVIVDGFNLLAEIYTRYYILNDYRLVACLWRILFLLHTYFTAYGLLETIVTIYLN